MKRVWSESFKRIVSISCLISCLIPTPHVCAVKIKLLLSTDKEGKAAPPSGSPSELSSHCASDTVLVYPYKKHSL